MGVGGTSRLATSEGPAGGLPSPLDGRRSAGLGPGRGAQEGHRGRARAPMSMGTTWLISLGALWKQALGGGSCEAQEHPWAAVKLRSELRRWERDGGGHLGV